jgi:cytochrome P450
MFPQFFSAEYRFHSRVSGYFTNEIAHSALLYHLLRNTQSMQRLKNEVRTAFSSLDQIDAAESKKLPFLNACISESLRLLPPLAGKFMSRRSPGAFIDGIWVSFGIQVFVDGYVVQRSPNNFVDPDEFRPDRFIDRGKSSRYEYDVHEA